MRELIYKIALAWAPSLGLQVKPTEFHRLCECSGNSFLFLFIFFRTLFGFNVVLIFKRLNWDRNLLLLMFSFSFISLGLCEYFAKSIPLFSKQLLS